MRGRWNHAKNMRMGRAIGILEGGGGMSLRLLVLPQILLCTTAVAQFSISIDALKDAWYSQHTTPTESYIHLSPSDFISLSGPKPDSESDLSADVWTAWDEKYFYLYAEVKDDVVYVGSA